MPTISEPRTESLNWKYDRLRREFIAGRIGEVTFIASLQIIGFAPRDARTEANLAKMERR